MSLTDEQWAVLEPLIDACSPHAKVPPQRLRRTIRAILWRHDNGAKWRALARGDGAVVDGGTDLHSQGAAWRVEAPAWLGAEARYRSRYDLPGRHLDPGAPEGGRGGQKGASAKERDEREALGRSRGGYGTKVCVIADSTGRAITFSLAPGQAHELPHAVPLLARLPNVPLWVVADRGYSSAAFREHVWNLGARPVIPPKRNETPVACPDWIYDNRNRVERLWARLKEWRAVATRYEKNAASFLGVLHLAATLDWIRR